MNEWMVTEWLLFTTLSRLVVHHLKYWGIIISLYYFTTTAKQLKIYLVSLSIAILLHFVFSAEIILENKGERVAIEEW